MAHGILERGYPNSLEELAAKTAFRTLPYLTRKFLYRQLQTTNSHGTEIPEDFLPNLDFKVQVFHSATAVFNAPGDSAGVDGMRREIIRCTGIRLWRNKQPRLDTVFVETDPEQPGMRGMHVARTYLFFSFYLGNVLYPCALIHWFEAIDDVPDEDTGMWIVEPEFLYDSDEPHLSVIHVDSILRAAHLIPVYGSTMIPDVPEPLAGSEERDCAQVEAALDSFARFYVNKYIDYHAHEIAF